MFLGPLEDTKTWATRSIDGPHRFLGRVYRLFDAYRAAPCAAAPTPEQQRALHTAIKRVTGARGSVMKRCWGWLD